METEVAWEAWAVAAWNTEALLLTKALLRNCQVKTKA